MRVYVATSWKNPYQGQIVDFLRLEGHEVYDFKNPTHGEPLGDWAKVDPEWKTWTAEQYRKTLQSSPQAAHHYMNDLRGMQWADACVLVLPCGRSAHLEAGWFAGQGKRCIILTRDGEEPELMALMATDICISVQEVLAALK